MTIFSTAAFLGADSGKRLKAVLGSHLDLLDGKPVQQAGDGFGRIEYTAEGQDWELYPVMPEWCIEVIEEGARGEQG